MDIINLAGTEDTPKIILDQSQKIYEISGRSLPEDAVNFYAPVLKWLDDFAVEKPGELEMNINLEYFNTASSKLILDIFSKMETLKEESVVVSVRWFYAKDDTDMMEAGEEYSELVEIPILLECTE